MDRDAQLWWKQSEQDYDNAKRVFTIKQYYLTAFLVQQSVEKALKALYLEKKRTFADKTHSLVFLGKTLDVPPHLLTHLRKINPDFIFTRYPDIEGVAPYEAYDESIAQERINQAHEVLTWIRKQLK